MSWKSALKNRKSKFAQDIRYLKGGEDQYFNSTLQNNVEVIEGSEIEIDINKWK